jgi:hypothetical protein
MEKIIKIKLGMEAHVFYTRTLEVDEEDLEFKASLDYMKNKEEKIIRNVAGKT